MTIRKATKEDAEPIWKIIKSVIADGDTYAFDPKSSRDEMISYWLGHDNHCYVAEIEMHIVGTYILKDNQPGLGSHIANGSYMVHPTFQSQGIGKALGSHSIAAAKALGYLAIQFNIVVSSNEPAISLWKRLGFEIIGTVPKGFNHRTLGYTDIHIMWRSLS